MTSEEIAGFVQRGKDIMTSLAIHLRQMEEWSAAFDARGGQPVLGQDALDIVSFVSNPLLTVLEDSVTMQTIIAKYRTDMGT